MVAVGQGGQALDVDAEQAGERLGLGLAELGELGGDVLHRAVALAELDAGERAGAGGAHRAATLQARYADRIDAAGDDTASRAGALVDALNADGYAASALPVGAAGAGQLTGIQLCQGHCPVQHVATEFPQFSEAETEAFSRLLGVHVQRLATLAHGDPVCTTFVPTPTTERPSS